MNDTSLSFVASLQYQFLSRSIYFSINPTLKHSHELSAFLHNVIILYYAMRQHKIKKNTKDKCTIKTYKNRELQNRQQENITAIYIHKKTEISKLSSSD